MVYDPKGGVADWQTQINTMKRDWQDQLITALTAAGITVTKATWNIDTYSDKGILITFFGNKIFPTQKFKDMISKATAIKWIISMWEVPEREKDYPENFSLVKKYKTPDNDGHIRVKVFKRDKVNV